MGKACKWALSAGGLSRAGGYNSPTVEGQTLTRLQTSAGAWATGKRDLKLLRDRGLPMCKQSRQDIDRVTLVTTL